MLRNAVTNLLRKYVFSMPYAYWWIVLSPSALLVLLVLTLSGCTQPIVWNAPETPQFRTDNYECTRDATYLPRQIQVPEKSDDAFDSTGAGFERGFAKGRNMRGPQVNEDLYIQCMEARGYER